MSTIQKTKELSTKHLLVLMAVTGIGLSTISFVALNIEFLSSNQGIHANLPVCENGLCDAQPRSGSELGFVQQASKQISENSVSNNEVFSGLSIVKEIHKTQDPIILGNKATLFAQKDSFIREGVKNTNEGASKVLRIMGSGHTNNRILISFNQGEIESIASNHFIESATLRLFVQDSDENWNGGHTISIHRLSSDWLEGKDTNAPLSKITGSENGVTWTCSDSISDCNVIWEGGSFSSSPTDSVYITNQVQNGYWITFDVTPDVKAFLSGETNQGWLIKKTNEDESGRINFASREAPTNVPELVLVMSQ